MSSIKRTAEQAGYAVPSSGVDAILAAAAGLQPGLPCPEPPPKRQRVESTTSHAPFSVPGSSNLFSGTVFSGTVVSGNGVTVIQTGSVPMMRAASPQNERQGTREM